MGVGQPEVEGHHRGLDEQAHDESGEGYDEQAIGLAVAEGMADLGQVEGSGAGVEEPDPEKDRVTTHAV